MANLNYNRMKRLHMAAIALATSATIVPKTVLTDQIKGILQQNKHGNPVLLTPEIKQLYNEVLDDIEVSHEVRKSLEPICTPGSIISHVGFVEPQLKKNFPNLKCLICIPENFKFVDTNYAPLSIQNEELKRDSRLRDGKDGTDGFVLSKSAQKYAIAREIYRAQLRRNYFAQILPALAIGQNFYFFHKFYTIFHKYLEHSRSWRWTIFGVIGFFSTYTYYFISDLFNTYLYNKATNKVKELGEEYTEGHEEYKMKIEREFKNLRVELSTKFYTPWIVFHYPAIY